MQVRTHLQEASAPSRVSRLPTVRFAPRPLGAGRGHCAANAATSFTHDPSPSSPPQGTPLPSSRVPGPLQRSPQAQAQARIGAGTEAPTEARHRRRRRCKAPTVAGAAHQPKPTDARMFAAAYANPSPHLGNSVSPCTASRFMQLLGPRHKSV
ncbi:hypothetical protein BKA56DRAFT_72064 [Ilyonectria sp. MPI-CAGE-AT-0026]|nr:hypothetical protein BKA56DRAFT_72064 [Ilyonectria sp. MPI-CAGE-AT-0026]